MPTIHVDMRVKMNQIRELKPKLRSNAQDTVREATTKIETTAKELCPVDTGALRASIYRVTMHKTDYEGNIARALELRPEQTPLPLAESAPGWTDYFWGIVSAAMPYCDYVEFGTSRMAAEPYLGPAADIVWPWFVARMKRVLA